MMKKLIILVVICIGNISLAFTQAKINLGYTCSYYGEKAPSSVYTFTSDNEAVTALKLITDASGLAPNFTILASDVPNAAATIINNERYILYNQTFMYNISQRVNYWASISILAHEIGHHLNGHSLVPGGSRPSLELEADKFSGFILAKLGASLKESQSAINALVSETGSTTHPGKSARLAAIANGWYSSSPSINKVSGNLSNVAKRPERIFLGRGGRKEEDKEDVFIKKSDNYTFSIISERGYIFSENEFKKISISDDMQVFWFPYYEAYGYVDNYSKIPVEQHRRMEYGAVTFTFTDFEGKSFYLSGSNLIIYYPSGGFKIISNGILANPLNLRSDLSYWQQYSSSTKTAMGLEDDYLYVYQINNGIKDLLLEVSLNDSKKAKSQKRFIISRATEYTGGALFY